MATADGDHTGDIVTRLSCVSVDRHWTKRYKKIYDVRIVSSVSSVSSVRSVRIVNHMYTPAVTPGRRSTRVVPIRKMYFHM